MKKDLAFISACFIFVLLCLGCSEVIYTQLYDSDTLPNYESKVYLIPKHDSIPSNSHIIADVDMREDWSLEYIYLKPKIEKATREKGGNLFKIREFYIGKNSKGAAVRILGTIYNVPESNIQAQLKLNNASKLLSNSNFLIYIYKEDAGLAALSSPTIYANGKIVGKLNNNSFLSYQNSFPGEVIFSLDKTLNDFIKLVVSPGNIYYLRVSQNVSTGASGNNINVQSGGYNYEIYKDEEGRFNFDRFLSKSD